jgi:RimJ/RimL family protein N-acetyltransferase
MVEAVGAYAFAAPPYGLGLNRVSLHHAVGNQASCRVAGTAGYAFEGVARGALATPDAGFEDMHVHARLAGDPPGPLERVVPAEPVEIVAGAYQLCAPDPDLDAAAVAAAGADADVARWNAAPADLDEARAWCLRRADWSLGTHASWAVKAASGGDLLGAISLFEIDAANSSCQAGYWVTPAARGRGVAAAALSAAAGFAFGALGLTRAELFHAVENTPSCRVAVKAGFAQEGLHRASYRYGDGELHDEHSHARLTSDR